MMDGFDLLQNDDNIHSLLEPPVPPYSSVTVRRACVVWLHCGQKNEFRHVCNYFHYLEMLEENLPKDARIRSRLLEFSLLSNLPPSSYYLSQYFPKLYRQNSHKANQMKAIRREDSVFNLEGFYDFHVERELTTQEVYKASRIIRRYCSDYSKSLNSILFKFKEFTKFTETRNSVSNISVYVKKQYLKDELITYKNTPKNFSFLDEDENYTNFFNSKSGEVTIKKNSAVKAKTKRNKYTNKVMILINEARKQEVLNLIPQFTGLTLKDLENATFLSQDI